MENQLDITKISDIMLAHLYRENTKLLLQSQANAQALEAELNRRLEAEQSSKEE